LQAGIQEGGPNAKSKKKLACQELKGDYKPPKMMIWIVKITSKSWRGKKEKWKQGARGDHKTNE